MQIPPTSAAGGAYAPSRTTASLPAAPADKARDDFLKWVHMSPAEQMRAEILGSMGLDEDKLKAMAPKEREKVEAKIKDLIHQKVERDMEKKKGVVVDVKV
jgi:hypothetical protein